MQQNAIKHEPSIINRGDHNLFICHILLVQCINMYLTMINHQTINSFQLFIIDYLKLCVCIYMCFVFVWQWYFVSQWAMYYPRDGYVLFCVLLVKSINIVTVTLAFSLMFQHFAFRLCNRKCYSYELQRDISLQFVTEAFSIASWPP